MRHYHLILKENLPFSITVSDSCDPMDYSPPGSSVYGIFQARILEWVAMSFSSSVLQNIIYNCQ